MRGEAEGGGDGEGGSFPIIHPFFLYTSHLLKFWILQCISHLPPFCTPIFQPPPFLAPISELPCSTPHSSNDSNVGKATPDRDRWIHVTAGISSAKDQRFKVTKGETPRSRPHQLLNI